MSERVRVIELCTDVAGQALGRLLAGFGHDVVRVEQPGAELRPSRDESYGSPFATLNAGKRSVALGDDERSVFEALIASADVVICDLTPQHYSTLGVAPDGVRERWPGVVWIAVTGFGLDDERSELPADSLLAESFGGLANLVGRRGRAPLSLGGEQAAYAAAFSGLFAYSIARIRQLETGRGELVDVALTDLAAFMDWKSEVNFATSGVAPSRSDGRGWWRIVPAADGWVGIVYDPQQWDRLVALIDDPVLRDPALADQNHRSMKIDEWMPVVESWIAVRPMHEVFELAQARGLPFGYNADMAALLDLEQYRERGFLREPGAVPAVRAPWQIEGAPWSEGAAPAFGEHTGEVLAELASQPARPAPSYSDVSEAPGDDALALPLEGVVVLDFGTVTAGAAASRILADFGATVIKIEAPDRPDQFRRWASSSGAAVAVDESLGVIPMFEANNAGKHAITLDLKVEGDLERFRALVPRAHVVLENFRVGVAERLSIDFASLRELNPELLYLSLASQGQRGPEARLASYGSTLDLLSGLASVTGYPGEAPIWSSYELNYPDQLAALVGAALVVHCLSAGVTGSHIDLAQRELVSWTLADRLALTARTGQVPGPEGNRRPGAMPHDTYPGSEPEGWLAVVARSDDQRGKLAELVGGGLEQLSLSLEAWTAAAALVDEVLARWTVERTTEESVAQLTAAGVPAVPVLSAARRAVHEHFSRRRVFVTSPGGIRTRGFPFVLASYEPQLSSSAPRLGADNDRIDEIIDGAARRVPAASTTRQGSR
jgi:crotonobetainyl-CoA:carnitine CoA-transferase CaiB-like acyl-CoA transferase